MKMENKVSIILSSYNHAKYIKEAIDSVLDQTFSNFELIIWDDASSDDSWEIISSYSDPRIKAFRNEENMRGGITKKAIAEVAAGKYIAIHHSDDIWESEKLAKQVAFLDSHPEIGAVFSQAHIIDENGDDCKDEKNFYFKIFDQPNRGRFEWLNFFFYKGNALCHPSVLIRKQCYDDCGSYRLGMAQLPDYDMWVRLCLKYEIYVMPEKLVRYRVRENNLNASGSRIDTRIRNSFEFLHVYENYRSIQSPEDFIKVFPETSNYFKLEGCDLGFILAMAALDEKGVKIKARELFALNQLFEIFSDPERAQKVNDLYNFTNKDFIALTAEHDIFGLKQNIEVSLSQLQEQKQISEILASQLQEQKQITQSYKTLLQEQRQITSDLNTQLHDYKQRAENLKADMEQMRCELEQTKEEAVSYTLSTSWSVTRPLRKVTGWLRRKFNAIRKKRI
ncbi:MAG: glycosyltransferase [Elusimicrobiota bacterium]